MRHFNFIFVVIDRRLNVIPRVAAKLIKYFRNILVDRTKRIKIRPSCSHKNTSRFLLKEYHDWCFRHTISNLKLILKVNLILIVFDNDALAFLGIYLILMDLVW